MDVLEAKNRLRAVSASTELLPANERDAQLRHEVGAILQKTPKPDQPALLDRLSAAFPLWPADVPPAKPPTDEEMIEHLRIRAHASDADRRRIEAMMRAAGLGPGLGGDDEQAVRDQLGISPDIQPETARMVEAFLVLLSALSDTDGAVRKFLQEHGLGMMMVGVPRVRDTVVKLLTLPDTDPSRHARRADLENAVGQLGRAVALLCHWPDNFADDASVRLAPARIEATVPQSGRFSKGTNYEGCWQEYRTRVGGRADESNVKAELLGWMAKVMRDTI
jgi:hypothetical protein